MDRFSFGPADNSIIQIAYSVADIEEEMRRYSELLRVGPWFLIGPFVPPKGVYRGAATKMQRQPRARLYGRAHDRTDPAA